MSSTPSSRRRAVTRDARELAAAEGISYTQALNRVAAGKPAVDPVFLAPWPEEIRSDDPAWQPVVVEELGWRALPADATPAQRARAESVWRPVNADRPCRCSGKCLHGKPCDDRDRVDACHGRLIHSDRLAVPPLLVTGWIDLYQCDTCGDDDYEKTVELPEVPWGTEIKNGTEIFPDVRRVVYQGDGYDPGCPECGARPGYSCRCGADPEPECYECGAYIIIYECVCA